MPLKAVLTKTEFDAMTSTDLRALYRESDGKYVLHGVEGLVPIDELDAVNAKLAEFRDNNRTLFNEKKALAEKVEALKDIDPVKVKAMETELAGFKASGVKDPHDMQVAIANAVSAALAPIEAKLANSEKEKAEAQQRLRAKAFEDKVWAIGATAGVDERMKKFLVQQASDDGFKLSDDGETIVAEKNGAPIYSKRRGKAGDFLTIDEWATEILPTQIPGMFKQSGGSGAQRQREGAGGGGQRVISNDPMQIGQNLDGIAKGEVTVLGTH